MIGRQLGRVSGGVDSHTLLLMTGESLTQDSSKYKRTFSEIETWDIQRKGAEDILAGNTTTSEAQFVTSLAEKRSSVNGATLTATDLATRINSNVSLASAVSVAALGKQQGQYDLANAATTQEELDNIVLSFDMTILSQKIIKKEKCKKFI